MKQALLALLFVVLLICPSHQLGGTLYLNRILANSDTPNTVVLESITVSQNAVSADIVSGTDFFGGLLVEQSNFLSGSISTTTGLVNVDLNLNTQSIFAYNALYGIDTQSDYIYSFDPQGNFVTAGTFETAKGLSAAGVTITDSGQTTLSSLFRPNGGFFVGDGVFTVDPSTGDITSTGSASVAGAVLLGSPKAENIYVSRDTSSSGVGGDTHIASQLGINQGGDLQLIPGTGTDDPTTNGHILFGRDYPDNIAVYRTPLSSLYADAGSTYFVGQPATSGFGGDIYLAGGDSLLDAGGDLYLTPGLSASTDQIGYIFLNPTNPQYATTPLVFGRPVTSARGSQTYFNGQNSVSGNGGDLYLAAGNVTSGTGGDVYLVPGSSYSFERSQNYIVLSTDDSQELVLSRIPTDQSIGPEPAGSTTIEGQNSYAGDGGLLAFFAGEASTSDSNTNAAGGDLILTHGASSSNSQSLVGFINIGNPLNSLGIIRLSRLGDGQPLAFEGQSSETDNGGDFVIQAGAAPTVGGTVFINSGGGGFADGNLIISAGSSRSRSAGDIFITGGTGETQGGSVHIASNDVISYGAGSSPYSIGDVVFQQASVVQFPSTVVLDGNLQVTRQNSNDQVVFSADPQNLISVNGQTILRQRQGNVAVVTDTRPDNSENIARLQSSLLTLLNALGPCGHGLISFGEAVGLPVNDCIVPSPVYTNTSTN